MKINRENWKWTREPKDFTISEEKIEIITNPPKDKMFRFTKNDYFIVLSEE